MAAMMTMMLPTNVWRGLLGVGCATRAEILPAMH